MQSSFSASDIKSRRGPRVVVGILLAVILLTAALAALGAFATTAQAWDGWVYISYPTWAGNATQGGSVVGIYAAIGNTWSCSGYGDWGDNIIYGKVHMNQWNAVSSQNFCRKWPVTYRDVPFQKSIYPTRQGQTFWIGPWGVWSN
jgi:hypothetical protein